MGITPERLSETLREICHALVGAGVPFAVAGGHAVAMHGHVRATRDIDLLVPAGSFDAAATALHRLGFACERQTDAFAHFVREPVPNLPGIRERCDLLLARRSLGLDAIRRAAAAPLAWQGARLPVAPVDAMLLMKLMALSAAPSRPNDRSDLLELWRLHGASIDVERLRADAQAIGDDVLSLLDGLLLGPAVRESGSADERWHRGL